MSAVTTIVSDVVEYILRLFRGKKDDLVLVESEQVTPDEALAFVADETHDPLQSQGEQDVRSNKDPSIELDSEESDVNNKNKPENETNPDVDLMALAPETPKQDSLLKPAANDPVIEPKNRDNRPAEKEPVNKDQTNHKESTQKEKPKKNDDDGLDDLAEQSLTEPDSIQRDRKETPDIDELADVKLDNNNDIIVDTDVTPDTEIDFLSQKLVTPDSFTTSDEARIQEAVAVETTRNPSMPEKLMDTSLQESLTVSEQFAFSAENKLSIGSASFDEPITMGALSDQFQAPASNDPNLAEPAVTIQLAAGQDFTQPKLDVAEMQPAAAAPGLGG